METILHAPRPTIEFQQALGRGLGGREGGDERDDLRGRFVGCGTSAGELRDWRDEGMGFFSFETAWRTLQGYEVMNMMRKGQVQGVSKGDITGQVTFIARLFGVAA
jgi:hypothetical protein